MKFVTRFGEHIKIQEHPLPAEVEGGKTGRTKQSFKDECDINNIMRRFEKTGQITHLNKNAQQYGDFSEVPEFQEAHHIVMRTAEQFQALPARVRDRFANSPENFLKFVNDPQNAEEMVALGLATERPMATPPDVKKGASKKTTAPKGDEKNDPKE